MSLFPTRRPRPFTYRRQYGKRRCEMDFHTARRTSRQSGSKSLTLVVLLILLLLLWLIF